MFRKIVVILTVASISFHSTFPLSIKLHNTSYPQLGSLDFTTKDQSDTQLPLFKKFPELQKKLPHVTLGNFPTPIKKLENLEKVIGAKNIYLKDDGVSSKPVGGNKIRKLEFLFGHALTQEATTVITSGDVGSNHALATISCAKKLGLRGVSALTPQLNTKYLHRNILMTKHLGGEILYRDSDEEKYSAVLSLCKELHEREGKYPYFIPVGGSNALGTIGFVNAVFELKEQIEKGIMPEPDYIYVTLGSAGTSAGLILGAKLAELKSTIIPVRISGTETWKKNLLANTFIEANLLLHKLDKSCPLLIDEIDETDILHDFAGTGYAKTTKEGSDAITLLHETEQIKLEGTYTGKSFAGMLHDIETKQIKDKVVLFWNTFCYGTFDNIFEKVDYKTLPKKLHHYFEEELQEFDMGV